MFLNQSKGCLPCIRGMDIAVKRNQFLLIWCNWMWTLNCPVNASVKLTCIIISGIVFVPFDFMCKNWLATAFWTLKINKNAMGSTSYKRLTYLLHLPPKNLHVNIPMVDHRRYHLDCEDRVFEIGETAD